MIHFRKTIDNSTFEFVSAELAQAFATEQGFDFSEFEEVEVLIEVVTKVRTVKEQMQFGDDLRLIFNEDNRNAPISFSVSLVQAIYTKFQTVEFLCRNGDLKNAKLLLIDMPIDPVFTQERKDKYILLIDNFMNFVV